MGYNNNIEQKKKTLIFAYLFQSPKIYIRHHLFSPKVVSFCFIKRNKEALIELDEIFYKFNGPAGYPTGTSWQDYDCIRGGNKEMDLFTYVTDREGLKTFIEIDEKILENLKRNQKLKEDIKLMPKNTDRIILMKSLGYSTKEISDELYLTPRYVRRVVQKYYNKDK